MMNRSLMQRLARWLAVAVLLGGGLGAMAQAEPTLKQIYDAAQAGRLEQAQTMIQQVLVLHPKSAKAHFVQAELAARQGQIARAREALAEAEKLAPGLPFAKPEAVQSLRAVLAAKPAATAPHSAVAQPPQAAPFAVSTAPAPASSSQMGLGLALQSNIAVEVGMSDDEVANLGIWSQLVGGAFMILGGLISDKLGRRSTLAVYLLLMSPPAVWLMCRPAPIIKKASAAAHSPTSRGV